MIIKEMEGDINNSSSSTGPGNGTGTGRLRFNIELRPGETTIVSWKKLIKEATNNTNTNNNITTTNKTNPSPSPPPPPPPPTVQQKAQEVQVALDEYFQEENPTIKCHEFTISKGINENLNELLSSSDCQHKKRKKPILKALGEKVDDHVPHKHAKLSQARLKAAKNVPVMGQSSNSQSLAASSEHYHFRQSQHSFDSPIGFAKKKPEGTSSKAEYSLHSGFSNDSSSAFVSSEDTDKQRNVGNNLKSEFSSATNWKYVEKSDSKQLDRQAKRTLADTSEHEFSTKARKREKNGSSGLPDLNIPASPIDPMISQKSATYLKDVPTLRLKGTTLERAIRDLEKVVAESRPPNVEDLEVENSSIAVKRRLPHEVKQKLAKVARLAQSSQGKISEELVNRLMSILGHLVQLRTLKRNLREMVLLGLSAKREKADRIQLIKKEVIEMIKLQASKLSDGAADDFQEAFHSEEKGFLKEKFCINSMLEDKICDLYDLYIQGMDEDKGPQIRKLYAELAELWPEGAMDNHGIKKAICKAKERRKASNGDEKVQEKNTGKKLPSPRMEVTIHGEVGAVAQPQAVSETMISETNKMIPSATAFDYHPPASAKMSSMLKSFNMDFPKQEKLERTAYPTLKEQLKHEQNELETKVNKLSLRATKESHKSHKRAIGLPDALTRQLAAFPVQSEKDRRPKM